MKKVIGRKEYDTDRAQVIHKHTAGSFGDAAGYEETLFQTPDGLYFLYVFGGMESPYPMQNILRISKEKAALWLEAH